jgi:hypothetical protein
MYCAMPKYLDLLTFIRFLVHTHMSLTFAWYKTIRRSYRIQVSVLSHYSSLFVLGPVRSPVIGQGLKPFPGDSLRVEFWRWPPHRYVD